MKGSSVKVMDYPAVPMTATSIYLSRSRLSEETASLFVGCSRERLNAKGRSGLSLHIFHVN